MTTDQAKKLSREQAQAKLDELKEGRSSWAQEFNPRFFKACHAGPGAKVPEVEVWNALTAIAFAPGTERAATAAQRDRDMPTADEKADALYKIEALRGDSEFWKRFKASDPHAVKAWNGLHDQAYAGEAAEKLIELGA